MRLTQRGNKPSEPIPLGSLAPGFSYDEAFISRPAVIEEEGLDFEIAKFKVTSLAQDVYVLRRTGADGG